MCQSSAIDSFLAKYEPRIATETQAVRNHLSRLFPRGFELVYDNYNALVFGFGPTNRAGDVLVSVAAYPKWVTLFFLQGANLADPKRILQGSGSQVRSVRLEPASILHSAPVQDLLDRALAQAEGALALAPPLTTVVKSVSAKQRPRRPKRS
jgi:hypothetical protein